MREPDWLCHQCAKALGWNGESKAMQGFASVDACDCCMRPIEEFHTFDEVGNGCTTNHQLAGNTCSMLGFVPTWVQIGWFRDSALAPLPFEFSGESYEAPAGREGRMYLAKLTRHLNHPREQIAATHGRATEYGKIRGVERHCTATLSVGSPVAVLCSN